MGKTNAVLLTSLKKCQQYCIGKCRCYDLYTTPICNDEANTAGCGYDGGDCCGDCANTDLCTECTCFEGGVLSLDMSCKSK